MSFHMQNKVMKTIGIGFDTWYSNVLGIWSILKEAVLMNFYFLSPFKNGKLVKVVVFLVSFTKRQTYVFYGNHPERRRWKMACKNVTEGWTWLMPVSKLKNVDNKIWAVAHESGLIYLFEKIRFSYRHSYTTIIYYRYK